MNYLRKKLNGSSSSGKEDWRSKLEPAPSMEANPLRFFVRSLNTLTGESLDETLPERKKQKEWPLKPPIIEPTGNDQKDARRYKALCREGIPPALRSAIWITSVVTKSRPYQSKEETEDFGTLVKVEVLDHGWDTVRQSLFPDVSDEDAATIPDFGIDPAQMQDMLLKDYFNLPKDDEIDAEKRLSERTAKGVRLITIFLYAARENLGVEYCPLLPDISAMLLSYMPVSYAYAAIREMTNTEDYYLPMSEVEHYAWCKTFGDLLRKMYPQTALIMSNCGVLTPDGLGPIFRRFFIPVLRREHVHRILDIFLIEGNKALFRIGTVILCLCTYYLTKAELEGVDAFWKGVKRVTHSKIFHFDVLVKQAYGFNGSKYRSRRSFPRRKFIQKLVGYNHQWASTFASGHILEFTDRPLGFVDGNIPIVLAKKANERLKLMEFLPFAYKSTKIEMIYSTNVHGRSVSMFYKHCAQAKHTITLIEVLNNGSTIGMFATDTWHNNRKMYGDGECNLFRLKPDPVCFHWRHDITQSLRSMLSIDSVDESENSIKTEAIVGQFMISRENFISMGNNEDGESGLRLNDDLSKGSSHKARGFNNDPLPGDEYTEFDIGLIEVYKLVREIDGRDIDKEDVWKGMFD